MNTTVVNALTAVAAHDVDAWADALEPFLAASGITTLKRIAMFVGQCAVESADFSRLEENLHYSAQRLCAVFPTHFTPEFAAQCAENPEAIASVVYAGRMGNGDVASGDGWRYRGRGLIQLTGKATYTSLARADRRAIEPDWVATLTGAAASACWFWTSRHLNNFADGWEITGATRVINGGTNGLEDRLARCNAALKAIGG